MATGVGFACLAFASPAAAAPTFTSPAGEVVVNGDVAPQAVATGDIDEDGDQDVISGGNGSSNKIALSRGPAPLSDTGGSWPKSTGGTGGVTSLVVDDLDDDGNLDWATANQAGTVSVFLGDGAGTPPPPSPTP